MTVTQAMSTHLLALEIADDVCAATVIYTGKDVRDSRGRCLWYDVSQPPEDELFGLERAVRYLKLRGLLRIHPSKPNYVKPRRAA